MFSRLIPQAGMLVTGVLAVAGSGVASVAFQEAPSAQDVIETSVMLSDREATLGLELTGGRSLEVSLRGGRILVNGDATASYPQDGQVESAWRELLQRASEAGFAAAWSGFTLPAGSPGSDELRAALGPALGEAPLTAANPPAADAATTTAAEAEPVGEPAQGRVEGGVVVQITELGGLERSLERIGLAPELARVLNGNLRPPLRIVMEADRYELPAGARVDETLVLVETEGRVAGTIVGNLLVADGSLVIEPTARVEGNVISVDASVDDLGGTITGELRRIEDFAPVVVRAPQRVEIRDGGAPALLRNVASGLGSLLQTIVAYLIFGFLGALTVYFFRNHLEVVSDTVSYSFGRAFLAGLAAEVLFFPILLVMVVLVLTWIAIPFYLLAAALAALLGYLAVAHAAGENLTRRRYPSWAARLKRSNSYYYVLNGLGVLLALFAAAAVAEMGGSLLNWAEGLLVGAGAILTWVAGTTGLGAVLLSRAGSQRRFARPQEVPALSTEPLSRGVSRRRSGDTSWSSGPGAEGIDEV